MTAAATKPDEVKPDVKDAKGADAAAPKPESGHNDKLQEAAGNTPPKPETKGPDGAKSTEGAKGETTPGKEGADGKPVQPEAKPESGDHHDEHESTAGRFLRESQEWLGEHGLSSIFGHKGDASNPLAKRAFASAAETAPGAKLDMATGEIVPAKPASAVSPEVALTNPKADVIPAAADLKSGERPADKPTSGDGSTEDPGWWSKLSQPFVDGYHKVEELGSKALSWSKEELAGWSGQQMGSVLDKSDNSIYSDMVKAGSNGFEMKAVTDANELKSLKISANGNETTFDADDIHRVDKKNGLDIQVSPEDHHVKIAKDGGSSYEKFPDGREVITKPNGDQVTKIGNDEVIIKNAEKGTYTEVKGKDVYQQFGDFKVITRVNEEWQEHFKPGQKQEAGVCSVNGNHASCDGDEARGGVTNEGKAIIQAKDDGQRIEIDGKNHTATLFDKDGKPVQGSENIPISDFEKKWGHDFKKFHWEMKGDKLIVTGADNKSRSEVDTKTNKVDQHLVATEGPHKGETLDINSDKGKVAFDYKNPEGQDIKKSVVNTDDPAHVYQEMDEKGNVIYNANDTNPNDVSLDGYNPDGSLDFSFNGDQPTYFEGVDIGADDSLSYSDGSATIYRDTEETRTSSEAAADTASGNAIAVAAAVSAKASNPADISASDTGSLMSALGDINSAIAQCASAGNFNGLAELINAKATVSDALARVVPETSAYDKALKQGFSAEQANKVGLEAGNTGTMDVNRIGQRLGMPGREGLVPW